MFKMSIKNLLEIGSISLFNDLFDKILVIRGKVVSMNGRVLNFMNSSVSVKEDFIVKVHVRIYFNIFSF